MRVLIIGSGAREHAIAWKIKQSSKVDKIFVAPGNAGTAQIAENIAIDDSEVGKLAQFAAENKIDLTVVGPEVPLCLGVVDEFEKKGLRVFGPNKEAAQLEGSKVFCKEFFVKHGIPTAKYKDFENVSLAKSCLQEFSLPVVIKADGLAAGKGVVICESYDEANVCLDEMMQNHKFGEAGTRVVIEEFLTGIEASLLCFVDGKTIVPMESAKDHKRAFDNDMGLNTGGMGTFSPNRLFNAELLKKVDERVLQPTMNGFVKDGMVFKGVLFVGLMINGDDIKVLEFNVRFGDPETEVVLPRMTSDIVDVFNACIDGTLKPEMLQWSNDASLCVIIASGGYPESYEKGKLITGLDKVADDVFVFHAGTKLSGSDVLSNGGRVLAVTTTAENIEAARSKVYKEIEKIKFEKSFYRTDIGKI